MKSKIFNSLFALCVLLIAGCATPQGDTTSEQRASVQQMARDTLAEAYRLNPGLQGRVKQAAGYGVFSNRGAKLLVMSSGNGYGWCMTTVPVRTPTCVWPRWAPD